MILNCDLSEMCYVCRSVCYNEVPLQKIQLLLGVCGGQGICHTACCVTTISIWKWDRCRGWSEGSTNSIHVA
jgi:hypothetical protein